MIFATYRRNTVSTQEKPMERLVVQLRLDAELSERLSKAMKEDGDDNKAGWIKRLLRRELYKRGIPSTN
ncbi:MULTISPECIES: hypothetical protein [Tenebrionibacter/Tenebrionicola group]|jgi:hypothetical protein|uniref:Uncharacterized protein n=2 Tax=Tenebrionibacter/Tenebrionicola group TaxID=2969848 RepID=A0A8K0V5N5_9ENTR|nr:MULTISPECIES: hypothetical protein [Tenebrionibacter/Tenebrionicola group]MBK4714595.1 hypothetical protein [Tenebrionibacter intestinalis]MBV5095049.1 hypothetical protein [Tenebrionicola larvae]